MLIIVVLYRPKINEVLLLAKQYNEGVYVYTVGIYHIKHLTCTTSRAALNTTLGIARALYTIISI